MLFFSQNFSSNFNQFILHNTCREMRGQKQKTQKPGEDALKGAKHKNDEFN
jgi:hypothetical protein